MNLLSAEYSLLAYSEPTDLRKGFDGLEAIVRSRFQVPLYNRGFLFKNRRRTAAKLLLYDAYGVPAILYYRAEGGVFTLHPTPQVASDLAALTLSVGRFL